MLVLSAHCENSSGGGTRCIRRAQVPCRDVNRVQMLDAKAEAEVEAKFNRPSPRPKLKRLNRTLYFTMKNENICLTSK